jgi:hypothetical protein
VVLDGARTDEQPDGDLRIGQPVPGHPGYLGFLGFLRGQLGRGLDRTPAGGLPDGPRFTPGPLGESVHPHRLTAGACLTVAAGSASRDRNAGEARCRPGFRGLAFTHARPGQSGIVVAPNNP